MDSVFISGTMIKGERIGVPKRFLKVLFATTVFDHFLTVAPTKLRVSNTYYTYSSLFMC